MESNILAKFEYNGKTYVYYREPENSNTIKYGILENNNIIETNDSTDIQVMNEASKKIFISSDPKNHIKLGTMIYHGKKFQQMFDEQSELKFFYEIKDGKCFVPSNEDSLALFEMFNLNNYYINNNLYDEYDVFLDNKPNKKKKDLSLEKIVKGMMIFGVSTIAVVSISACLLRTNAIEEIFRPNYETTQTENKYNEEYLLKALDRNKNLSEEEKKVFKDKLEFVMKYSEYTNFPELSQRLEGVRSEYYNGYLAENKGAGADYNYFLNVIRDFYSEGFDVNNRVDFGHEAGHCCASPKCNHPGIFEATTEIVTSESGYAISIGSYYDIAAFQKIMYEIIGQDPFGQYQQSGNIKHIINPLLKIINDNDLANQLIVALDNVLVYGKIANNADNKYTEQEVIEAKQNYETNNKFIVDTLSRYFYIVKGYNMDEDLIVKLLLTSANITPQKFYFSGCYELGAGNYVINKGYFLEDYKNKYSNYTVLVPFGYPDGTRYAGIIIDEANRRVDPNADSYYIGDTQFFERPNGERFTESIVQSNPNPQAIYDAGSTATSKNNELSHDTYFGHGLYEAAVEIASKENTNQSGNKISQYRLEQATYFKILYEILGKDTMQKYYETQDINIIVKALASITSNESEAISLIDDIDSLSYNYYNLSVNPNNESSKKIIKNIGKDIREQLNRYFELVYGYSATEDALISFYYLELQSEIVDYESPQDFIKITDKNGEEITINPYESAKVIVTKSLLDSNYSKMFPTTTINIYFPNENNSTYINIDENNRRMDSRGYGSNGMIYYFDEAKDKQK